MNGCIRFRYRGFTNLCSLFVGERVGTARTYLRQIQKDLDMSPIEHDDDDVREVYCVSQYKLFSLQFTIYMYGAVFVMRC